MTLWPAKPANEPEPGSPSGPASPPNGQPPSLIEALIRLTEAMHKQNELLGQIAAANAQLVAMLAAPPEDEDESECFMNGKPLREVRS